MVFLSVDASGFLVLVSGSFVDISELHEVFVNAFVTGVFWMSTIKYNHENRIICKSVVPQKYSYVS